ncbi:hypothetical protein [Archaeoglobus fulgidus]|nr:hypothetical protein [Archaeoglobus fulgidus]
MEVEYPESAKIIFPKPEYWFRWEQRYVYEDVDKGEVFFLDGYGKLHEGIGSYEAQVFLNENREVVSVFYQRLAPYDTKWEKDREGWTWFLKGSGKLVFDTEIVSFDYPLVLGKRWRSEGRMGAMTVESRGVVIAYISPDGEVEVAEGYSYQPPVKPPEPLEALDFMGLDELLEVGKATTTWDKVVIPDGPRKGENVQGYYVTMVEYLLNGSLAMKMEIWKDVRGCVPVIAYHPAGMRTERQVLVARSWCL